MARGRTLTVHTTAIPLVKQLKRTFFLSAFATLADPVSPWAVGCSRRSACGSW